MSITINLWHVVWGVVAYLGVGVLSYLPLTILANLRVHSRDNRLWFGWLRFVIQVVAWPLAIAEERGWL